jgi:hypothetical protein
MGVETIVYNFRHPIPTMESIKEACSLANRTGMTSIVGVGSTAVIDLAKGTQYFLENRVPRFSPIYKPSTSDFKVPLITFPTTPISECYQPSILIANMNTHIFSRYPLPNAPQSVSLIPTLVVEEITSNCLLKNFSPSEIFSLFYFSLLARYLDTFHSFCYLHHTSDLQTFLRSEDGTKLRSFYDICTQSKSLSTESIYELFHEFNSQASSLSLSLFQSSLSQHPTTNPATVSIMNTANEFALIQQTTKRLTPLPEVVLSVLTLHGYLSAIPTDDVPEQMNSLVDSYSLFSQWLGDLPPRLLLQQLEPLYQKILLYQKNHKSKTNSSHLSFLIEEKIQREEEDLELNDLRQSKQKGSPEKPTPQHLDLLRGDAFLAVTEEIF